MILNYVNTLTLRDAEYPAVLRDIPQPPNQLFWMGAEPKSWLDKPAVAIVGSRKASPYGKEVTTKLTAQLARAGVVIISGLAFGIDATAHRAALEAGGLTIAVLPTSLDQVYPTAHQNLASQIMAQGGTLISEYPRGAVAYKQNFIARNRIVSGFAEVLLITEAAANSGSLHTARFALEQGKTVMAVPGNITSLTSEGCNNLIKSGAVPVSTVEDVFFALNIAPLREQPSKVFRGTAEEQAILQLIAGGMHAQEEIALAARLDGATLASLLTTLEIGGYIRPQGGGNWVIS